MDQKKQLKQWAADLGFVAAGFTSAAPVKGLKETLKQRQVRGEATSFEASDFERRTAPKAVWPACETVLALAYPLPLSAPANTGEGILARSAVGEDYHRLVRTKLEILVTRILKAGWSASPPKVQVDTGPLVERAFAVRAGVGFIGRNQQLIVPGYGSFVALALVLLDFELLPDQPVQSQCGECVLCQKACPAQILGQESFAATQCVSYLTQTKEVLDQKTLKKLGIRIFGCDTCQEVCPHNRRRIEQERELESKPEPSLLRRGVDLFETLSLTKGEFNRRFRPSAAGWRGKGILQRNAYLALYKIQDQRLEEWLEQQTVKGELPSLILPYLNERKERAKNP